MSVLISVKGSTLLTSTGRETGTIDFQRLRGYRPIATVPTATANTRLIRTSFFIIFNFPSLASSGCYALLANERLLYRAGFSITRSRESLLPVSVAQDERP